MLRILLFLPAVLMLSCDGHKQPGHKGRPVHRQVHRHRDTLTLPDPQGPSVPQGKLFALSKVLPAAKLLGTDDIRQVIEQKLNKKVWFIPDQFRGAKAAHCFNNGLIQTVQESYDQHRPLLLTPDHVWLAVCQGASIHINQNFKRLESKIFVGNKPAELVFRDDSLSQRAGSWQNLVAGLSGQTRKYTKADFYSFFVPDFSTTTAIEKTAYQVTLLESYKKAFAYVGESGCGIPSIRLGGTKKDWEMILTKLDMLENIGMKDWAEILKPVIREFIRVFDGKISKPFWEDMYKNLDEYGRLYISGWIIKFFPYLKATAGEGTFDEKMQMYRMEETYRKNEFMPGDRYLMSTLTTEDFPSGISKISVRFRNYFDGSTREMEVYSGFLAIRQYDDKTIQPLIAWAVCEKNAGKPSGTLKRESGTKDDLKHKPYDWIPHYFKGNDHQPVYDIKRFGTAAESKAYVRKYLADSFARCRQFQNVAGKTGLKVTFVVLSSGKITDLTVSGNRDPALREYFERLLVRLPKPWFPAMAPASEVMVDYPEEAKDYKIKINSMVTIEL